MIAPLRSYHRRAFVLLALLLPVVFAAGLAKRRPEPPPVASATSVSELRSAQVMFSVRPQGDTIEILPAPGLLVPDPLVYWSATPAVNDALPQDARLLGRPAAGARHSVAGPGRLLLYSGAHQRVVDTLELP